jgi:hypothetical protein
VTSQPGTRISKSFLYGVSPYQLQCGGFGVSFSDSVHYLSFDPVSLRSEKEERGERHVRRIKELFGHAPGFLLLTMHSL